ncbi:MAG TPA: hypothetical protein VIY47_15475 [Ignavibacteriaceae bacterium]
MKTTYTREEVVRLIYEMLQYSDQVIDYIENENSHFDSEMLLRLAEDDLFGIK